MSTAEKQESRNIAVYVSGLMLAWVGLALLIVGGVYILNNETVRIILLDGQDSLVGFMAKHRYDATWAGLMLMCLGISLFWQAEDDQGKL